MRYGIMLNEDDSHFFYTRNSWQRLGEAEIRAFIRQYAGTQVTDFLLCCAGRIVDYPSKVRDSWLDKYDQSEENGIPVNYRDNPVVRGAHRLFREEGLDFYAICIDELRKIGVRPWLSIRMNDCHCNDEPASFLHPRIFHEHPEYRRVTHRPPIGYFDRCFDYARPEIRQMMLDSVEETVMRYDADGLEVDWQREIFCFAIGHEWEGIALLNQFMRDVRAIVNRAAEKWGHPIAVCARTLSTPQAALDCGFDVLAWAREGLIDVLVPTPRWATTDADIPVELWKRLLEGTGVQLAPGIEILQKSTPQSRLIATTVESVSALAAQFFSFGADKVYLFNYMDAPEPEKDAMARHAFARHAEYPLSPQGYPRLLRTAGAPETAVSAERRHVVTYADVGPVWFRAEQEAALPLAAQADGSPAFVRVRTGDIPSGAAVEIRLGTAAAGGLTVYANSVPCAYLRTEPVYPEYTDNPTQVFRVENDGHLPPFLVVEILAHGQEAAIDYVEVHVLPVGCEAPDGHA